MDTFATFHGFRIIPILNPFFRICKSKRPEYQHLQCANESCGCRGTTALQSTCFPQWDTQFLAFVAVSDYVIQFLLFLIHSQKCGLGVSRLGKHIGQLIHAPCNLLSPGECDG